MFAAGRVPAAVDDAAWLQAMLDFEAALARASARVGIVPTEAAEEIAAACRAELYDVDELGRASADAGNPAAPLVKALTAQVGEEAAAHVHRGATSQDVVDTAAMLVAKQALAVLLDDLHAAGDACARLADAHRETVVAGRTLLQQAAPLPFGLKAASWLSGLVEARTHAAACDQQLAAQLGGAVGSLAALGDDGLAVAAGLARELGLTEPALPWHTIRVRVGMLAGVLGVTAGVVEKIARDVILLAQTEVGEAREAGAEGRGGSSTMPQKQNPVGAVAAAACACRVPGLVATLLSSMGQEHERAAEGWQAEWETLSDLLRLVGSATAHLRVVLEGLALDPDRMRENLDRTGGLLLAESVVTALTPTLGRAKANKLVTAASKEAAAGVSFHDALMRVPEIAEQLGAHGVAAALSPESYLGVSSALIDRALAAHHRDD
jgi:3-carboxy-cis,cis-muconate cycloisomerase